MERFAERFEKNSERVDDDGSDAEAESEGGCGGDPPAVENFWACGGQNISPGKMGGVILCGGEGARRIVPWGEWRMLAVGNSFFGEFFASGVETPDAKR